MNCQHCNAAAQTPNTACTACGAFNVQMAQSAVLPPLPAVRATWQCATTGTQQQGQQGQQVVVNANSTGLTWAKMLAAIGIALIAMVVIADFVLDWVSLKSQVSSVELAKTEKTLSDDIVANGKKVDSVEGKVDKVDQKLDKVEKNLGDGIIAVGKQVAEVDKSVDKAEKNIADGIVKLGEVVIDDGKATRQAVANEGAKVRWSVRKAGQSSDSGFDEISKRLERMENRPSKSSITVRIAK